MSLELLIAVILLIVLVFIVSIAIGANDETMASVVGAKIVTLNVAILLGAFLQIIGAQLLGVDVSKTIGADMVNIELPLEVVLIIAIAMTIWLLLVSVRGYPISTTHSIVGCVMGIGLWLQFQLAIDVINWFTMLEIVIGWILSPVFGLVIAFCLQYLIRKFVYPRTTGLERLKHMEWIFGILLLVMVLITGLSRGGNDVAKAVGILVLAFPDPTAILWGIPLIRWFLLIGGVGMAIGLFLIGRRVVATVGREVTELRPSSSFAAESGVALVLLIGTIVGLPLSGTHVLVTAVIGVGLANRTPIGGPAVKKIVWASILTVPVSAAMALGLFFLYAWLAPLFPVLLTTP
ncbi:MAG: inorganic phosphate transporter [Candidatus Hermodarchaeota archaeon]